MDLATLEARKAMALDAFHRGELEEADELYGALTAEYEHHGFDEGALALVFNHLLVVLEAGRRPRITALMGQLAELLTQAPHQAPLVAEVASRICTLFADPFQGVAHEASEALVAIAAERVQGTVARARTEAQQQAIPDPAVLAELSAEDAALCLAELATQTQGQVGLPGWLVASAELLEADRGVSEAAYEQLDTFVAAAKTDDVLHAYPALVMAFELSVTGAPVTAAELSIGLSDYERRGLPERLAFTPRLPEERRLAAAVEFHGRLAIATGADAGAERLSARQWAHVGTLSTRWLTITGVRTQRGGGRGGDLEREAMMRVWRARAWRAEGRLELAESTLEPLLVRARRHAFEETDIAGRLIREAADVFERRGERVQAAKLYGELVTLVLPSLSPELALPVTNTRLDDLFEAYGPAGILHRIEALTGWARCSEQASLLQTARRLLAMVRVQLTPRIAAKAALSIELSGCVFGVVGAPMCALEAARALGDSNAIALAQLHRGLVALSAEDVEPSEGLALLGLSVSHALEGAAGAIRRAAVLQVALANLDASDGALTDDTAMMLRRVAEVYEGSAAPDGAGAFEVFLPPSVEHRLEGLVRRLLDDGHDVPARRLCAALRRYELGVLEDWGVSDLGRRVSAKHLERFRARWIQQVSDDGGPEIPSLLGVDPPRLRPLVSPGPGELRIAFRVFDTWTVAFAERAEGVTVHRWPAGYHVLKGHVDAVNRALSEGGAFGAALTLHRLLIEPLANVLRGIERIVVVPDGPLCALPFGVLWAGGFLVERFAMAVAWPLPTLFEGPVQSPGAVVRIIGDAATAHDLQISTLAHPGGFDAVEVRHGEALSDGLSEAMNGARVLHLVGGLEPGGMMLQDEAPPTALPDLAQAMAAAGVVTAALAVSAPEIDQRRRVAQLAAGTRGGLLVARRGLEDGDLLLDFMAGAAHAESTADVMEALAEAQRAAIKAKVSPAVWAGLEIYIAE